MAAAVFDPVSFRPWFKKSSLGKSRLLLIARRIIHGTLVKLKSCSNSGYFLQWQIKRLRYEKKYLFLFNIFHVI